MTKKIIKISVSVILAICLICGLIYAIMENTTKSYAPKFATPSQIIIYKDSESANIAFNKDHDEFEKIYNLITSSSRQSNWNAFRQGNLNKKAKVLSNETKTQNFSGIKVRFLYSSPKALKCNGKMYSANGAQVWYENLIFDISNTNWQYNKISIINPENTLTLQYNLNYEIYSNLNKTYEYISTLI